MKGTKLTGKSLRRFLGIAIVGSFAASAHANVLFSDNFNTTGSSANWTINTGPSAPAAVASQQDATFAYDYSAMGIPAAPGSSDTLGMRLRANIPGSAAAPVVTRPSQTLSGISVSPAGMNFGTNYQATFYAWSNFNGSPNASGLADNGNSEGGTNNLLFAVGTSGTVPLVVGNTGLAAAPSAMDGIGFATTGDGGITNDYRVYPQSGTIVPTTTAGVYAAGSNSNTAAYYMAMPSLAPHSAPAIQQSISSAEYALDASNTQAGQTQIGAFGFAWHKVVLTKNGGIVTWDIDDTRIATFDASALTLGGGDIAIGESDVNGTTTRHPSLLFSVIDNLTVTDTVPEPASFGLLATGLAALGLRRRRAI